MTQAQPGQPAPDFTLATIDGQTITLAFLKERLPDSEGRDWLGRQGPYVKLIYHPYDWGLNSVR